MADSRNNRTAQQATERRHIESFLESCRIAPESIEYADKPDAVLVLDGRRIGLEHRELTEEDLAANARNLVALEGLISDEMKRLGVPDDVQVAVSTVNAAAPFFQKRRHVEALATSIANFVAANAPALTATATIRVPAADVAPQGVLGADPVVARHPRLRGGPFAFVSWGFWGPVDASVVVAVEEKEVLLPTYRTEQRLDEVWLLLVTGETWVQATDSVLTEHTLVQSQFDRVYVLDVRAGAMQRLDVGGRSSSAT